MGTHGDHTDEYMGHRLDGVTANQVTVLLIVMFYFDSYTFASGTLKNSTHQVILSYLTLLVLLQVAQVFGRATNN